MNKQDKFAGLCADMVQEHPNRDVIVAAAALNQLMDYAKPEVKYTEADRLAVPAQQYQAALAHLINFLGRTPILAMFAEGLVQMDDIAATVKKTQDALDTMGVKQP